MRAPIAGELNYGSPGNGSNQSSTGREAQAAHGHRADACSLSRRTTGSDGGARQRGSALSDGLCGGRRSSSSRQADCARRYRTRAVADAARGADGGRSGLSRPRQFELVGDRRPKGHAGTDPRTPQPGYRRSHEAIRPSPKQYATLGVHVPTQTREQFVASLGPKPKQWAEVIRRGKITLE